MKSFEFSLERIRNYKTQVLDKEKKTLGVLKQRRDEIERKILSLEEFSRDKTLEMQQKQLKGISMSELLPFNFLLESTRKQIEMLHIELRKADEVLEAQRKIVLSIYQEKTGMDKLEEKQAEEYRLLEAKTVEGEIMQAISNSMARRETA